MTSAAMAAIGHPHIIPVKTIIRRGCFIFVTNKLNRILPIIIAGNKVGMML